MRCLLECCTARTGTNNTQTRGLCRDETIKRDGEGIGGDDAAKMQHVRVFLITAVVMYGVGRLAVVMMANGVCFRTKSTRHNVKSILVTCCNRFPN